jgi:hypothetical protein
MTNLFKALQPRVRSNLRGNMHKVAAVMARGEGIPLTRDEVTIKEAALILGIKFHRQYLEKAAMLDGLMCLKRLG